MSLKDDLLGAAFLHHPSLTIKEQGSHACDGAGCLASFETALDLQVHQVLGHPKFSMNFLEFSKDINGNEETLNMLDKKLTFALSSAADLRIDAHPKLMALLHWMLAPTPDCNFNDDD